MAMNVLARTSYPRKCFSCSLTNVSIKFCSTESFNERSSHKFESTAESLAAKGFSRSSKSYKPAQDVKAKLKSICESNFQGKLSNSWLSLKFESNHKKHKFLSQCEKEFDHPIPNSLLFKLSSVYDVLNFYKTPVNCSTPYLDLQRRKDLPKNLSIMPTAHRFHPNTDTFFNGVTAYPDSSTLVTSIKFKKMYKGYTPKKPWKHELHLE